jgi:hypothetical protein
MKQQDARKITNDFNDTRLISLAAWRHAKEFNPRDKGGPYVVSQQGYDPQDIRMQPEEFLLGRSGRWLAMKYFFQMPVPERRAEFVFATAAEVMQVMEGLPSNPAVISPDRPLPEDSAPPEGDDMAAAIEAGRQGTAPAGA